MKKITKAKLLGICSFILLALVQGCGDPEAFDDPTIFPKPRPIPEPAPPEPTPEEPVQWHPISFESESLPGLFIKGEVSDEAVVRLQYPTEYRGKLILFDNHFPRSFKERCQFAETAVGERPDDLSIQWVRQLATMLIRIPITDFQENAIGYAGLVQVAAKHGFPFNSVEVENPLRIKNIELEKIISEKTSLSARIDDNEYLKAQITGLLRFPPHYGIHFTSGEIAADDLLCDVWMGNASIVLAISGTIGNDTPYHGRLIIDGAKIKDFGLP